MPKCLQTVVIFFLLSVFYSQSQHTIWNSQFEDWEDFGAFEEPDHWSSLKTADNLAASAPIVLFKDNTGRNGGYCARLEVKATPFGFDANGIMTTGRVHAQLDPEKGSVYTDITNNDFYHPLIYRADSITGWFKYSPVSGDRAKVEAVIHHGQDSLPAYNEANYLARARYDIENETTQWTRFAAPFIYTNTLTEPEYLLIVATAGDSTIAKAGSTAWFDDFGLVYNWSSSLDYENEDLQFTSFPSRVHIEIQKYENYPIDLLLYDPSGKLILKNTHHTPKFDIPLQHAVEGVYIAKIQVGNALFTRKFHLTH